MKKQLSLLILLCVLFLSTTKPAFAALAKPYIVEEKPQVLFGDSTPVSTYFGLENYTHNFVNGYMHFTFTYTHSSCCIASYPPNLYVTNLDPRATTTPVVKYLRPIFVP